MIRIGLKGIFLFALAGVVSCGRAENNVVQHAKTSGEHFESISHNEAFSEIALDSTDVENFVRSHRLSGKRAEQLRQFYRSRDYQFAWFNRDGLAQQGRAFWNLHNQYLNVTRDSSLFNRKLHRQMKALLEDEELERTDYNVTNLDLELTDHFFDYARYAYAGKIDPDELQWHIPRKKINAVALLDSLIQKNGRQLDKWEPVSQQYKLVRKEVLRLYDIQKKGGWPLIQPEEKTLRQGDSSAAVVQLKQRLSLSGDYASENRSPVFTYELKAAVKRAQKRFGLVQDGIVGAQTLRELNVPVTQRIEQLLTNMERMRWMPAQGDGVRLVANIPEFRLHVFDGDEQLFQMKIVVGRAANRTVIFDDKLQYIVFSPYWNVPRSIVRNEILPAMQQNPGYLSSHNMEQTGTRGGLPVIRQKPGGNNALGRVKFLFPNSYSIYFHDTPAKSLFDNAKRAFSHGCIRLEQPKKLAEFLLRNNSTWTDEKITEAMYAGNEKWVTLDHPIPVEITYFTAWVDEEGRLNFRDDIYGHDRELANHLFTD